MRRGLGFHDRHSPFRFNPATLFIGGAVKGAFYDPSDLSTLFQDAAGTTPVTAIGDPVGRILDKSGNGKHATQSSASSRPLLQQTNGLYHLTFDGSNDSMLTGSIDFTGTDKMTVWAGVTKSSDAAAGVVAELSDSFSAYNGTFILAAPSNTNAYDYSCRVKGTLLGGSTSSAASYIPPVTNVATMRADIANDVSILRVNGAQAASTSNDLGTGNFGNFPLFIGRRNNTSLPFNGRLYGLIVLGAAASDWQVYVTEQWMAGKTGLQF